jgi:hypothetical protein
MVCYLSESSDGIARYAETDQGVIDVPRESSRLKIEYAEPDEVHPSAFRENVSVRQQGYWVNPETMPKKYLWANGEKPLPDVLPGFVSSSRFKDLVEQFEPGVHQFVPVDIYKKRDGVPVTTYYWFIVGQRLDSVDREQTTFVWKAPADDPAAGYWFDQEMDKTTFEVVRFPDARMVFSNKQIAGHHIWHDPHILTFNNGLCSDAFSEALRSSGITGVTATPRESA